MIDLIYLAKDRPEFTAASLRALAANTNWELVRRIRIYTDGAQFPYITTDCADEMGQRLEIDCCTYGGPVAIMNAFLAERPADGGVAPTEVWAKIDNDVIVPPGWLDRCLAVMENQPFLDLLGIEPPASRTRAPWTPRGTKVEAPEWAGAGHHVYGGAFAGYAPCRSIGGIGLFRSRAFAKREAMKPFATYGGFTDWQERQRDLVKGWVVPPLGLFLLDRLPFDPWASLSVEYIAKGWQRPWTPYDLTAGPELWYWWYTSAGQVSPGRFL